MSICKEKPATLPPLDAIGFEPVDQASLSMTRGGSGRHYTSSGAIPPSLQASIDLGFDPSTLGKGTSSFNPLGNFASIGASKLRSKDRFAASAGAIPVIVPFAHPMALTDIVGQGGRERTRTKRGEKRSDNKAPGGNHQQGPVFNDDQKQRNANLKSRTPLRATVNRLDRNAIVVDPDSPEMVDRKVTGLLNKLTMEKFDSISDQIIIWGNKSEKENNGRTLYRVVQLLFEHAICNTWPEVYARLCKRMMEQISDKVQNDGIKNNDGKPIAGGQLFRKYLLNRCHENFERSWGEKEVTAASKSVDAEAVEAANDNSKADCKDREVTLYSEEYYAAQNARYQGLGFIKFFGELFKLQMLTERIMHKCVKKLLSNVDNLEEEEIESLCKLLATVGSHLDTPKARAHLDVYFSRMRELTKSPNVNLRLQFMLQVCRSSFLYVFICAHTSHFYRTLSNSVTGNGWLEQPLLLLQRSPRFTER